MKKIFLVVLLITSVSVGVFLSKPQPPAELYGAPPYIEDDGSAELDFGRFGNLSNWTRPEGPLRVGLQAGHWKHQELPDELARLRARGGGTSSGSVAEWEVNLVIAEETKKLLEAEGIVVDILPATIPPAYYADVVVAIHADGSTSPATSGFKVAAPRRDRSGKAPTLARVIEEVYQQQTKLAIDPNITRNMTGYYAFNWRRYDHSIHPMAPAVILEMGFLTNPTEARLLIQTPEIPAKALMLGILTYLDSESSLSFSPNSLRRG